MTIGGAPSLSGSRITTQVDVPRGGPERRVREGAVQGAGAGRQDVAPVVRATAGGSFRRCPAACAHLAGHTHGGRIDVPWLPVPRDSLSFRSTMRRPHIEEAGRHLYVSGDMDDWATVRLRAPAGIDPLSSSCRRSVEAVSVAAPCSALPPQLLRSPGSAMGRRPGARPPSQASGPSSARMSASEMIPRR